MRDQVKLVQTEAMVRDLKREIKGLRVDLGDINAHYVRLHVEFTRRDDLLNDRLRKTDQHGKPL